MEYDVLSSDDDWLMVYSLVHIALFNLLLFYSM